MTGFYIGIWYWSRCLYQYICTYHIVYIFCHYLKCWLICTTVAVFGKFLLWSRCLYQHVCTYHIVYNILPLSKMLAHLYYGNRIREIFAVIFAILWIFSLYQLFSILAFGLECLCVPFLSGFPNSEKNGYENSLAISNSYTDQN